MENINKVKQEWAELTELTRGKPFFVESVRLEEKDIAIQGRFELPQLAKLNLEDQVFVIAFIRCHGSIKDMEKTFGVSYPTIKARLARISESLEFVEVDPITTKAEILEKLKRGEISAKDAIRKIEELP